MIVYFAGVGINKRYDDAAVDVCDKRSGLLFSFFHFRYPAFKRAVKRLKTKGIENHARTRERKLTM